MSFLMNNESHRLQPSNEFEIMGAKYPRTAPIRRQLWNLSEEKAFSDLRSLGVTRLPLTYTRGKGASKGTCG